MWEVVSNSFWSPPLQWGAVIGASLVAAVMDVRKGRIPNWLTVPVGVAGLAANALAQGLPGLGEAILGALLCGAPFVLLFLFAGGGAGDAKLMAAHGAWLGPYGALLALVCVAGCGGVLALGWALACGRLGGVLRNLRAMLWGAMLVLSRAAAPQEWSAWRPAPATGSPMPYGLAILAGVCLGAFLGWPR